MKTRKFLAILLCLLIASVCFACGDDYKTPEGPSDKTPDSSKNYKVTITNNALDFRLYPKSDESAALYVVVREDGVKVNDPEIKFASEDQTVATVDDKGIVTPVGVGDTTVTATFMGVSAKATVKVSLGTVTSEQINTFDREYINVFGRTFIEDGKLNVHHVASGIEVNFYGTELTADLDLTGNSYGRVYVDDDKDGKVIKLETKEDFVIADGLNDGAHTVRFLKCNELDEGQLRISNLSADKFLLPPKKSDRKIEFIGDSITCGYGVLGGNGKTLENSDACLGYAYLTAQALGWDYSIVALSGIGVDRAVWTYLPMTQLYKQVSYLNTDQYDFPDAEDVDVVVLNLGTNDAGWISSHADYGKTFADDYAAFLTFIRSKRPNAYIVCTYGMMGVSGSVVDKGITTAVKSMNDDKISYLSKVTANNAGAVGHPSKVAQKNNSNIFVKYINGLFEA